ncbi:MAG: hypothetical protein ACRC2T_00390 [Thermoguttaceae bacterium]
MISLEKVPIMEPTGKVLFSSKQKLVEHVQKHVLNRDESWVQLIDSELITAARQELETSRTYGTKWQYVCREYYRIIANLIVKVCKEGREHRHQYCEPLMDEQTTDVLPENAIQIVQAWESSKKIIIIAKSFVRNGEFQPYRIHTAYRPYPKLSGKSLKKRILHEKQNRYALLKYTELALHDNATDNQ